MVKYCPVCEAEFEDAVPVCPKDKMALLKRPIKDKTLKFISIYAAKDLVELERVVGILAENGILAEDLNEGVSQLPVASDTRFVIAVSEENIKMAKEKIQQAIADRMISTSGSFL